MKNVTIISSKSDAHRAYICAALSKEPCNVICKSTSRDIEATRKCLAALKSGESEMHPGESGSTLRFLLPVMGALGHKAQFYGEGRLPERPLSPLYEELCSHGCSLSPQGSLPLTIEGRLKPGTYTIAGDVSSQYISGLLFALPLLDGDSRIDVTGRFESKSYVDMTLKVLRAFGIKIEEDGQSFIVAGNQSYHGPENYIVEGDWSNGCFWLAAGALTDDGIRVKGLDYHSLQGDREILNLLQEFGAEVTIKEDAVEVRKKQLKGIDIDASQIPDMVPILTVVASVAEGDTVIRNAGRLRIKESDRLSAVTQVMTTLGADIEELPEGLIIHGVYGLTGGRVSSYNDHRIAMMAAIASLVSEGKVVIEGKEAVSKSYPEFFNELSALGLADNVE
ncbi:MAG: 3-phosphoshikimate 1-carboxyvinyltransferase [Eubacteriaceae bacterium]|nr:3-phosphoshikimate 1-carboxyvinyltransferase [Eubacteriaceae bacterium]